MPHLRLICLGSLRMFFGGVPLSAVRSSRVQSLLAYLAIEADRAHSRDALAALFWPDESERAAKQNLRQALYELRQLLGEPALEAA